MTIPGRTQSERVKENTRIMDELAQGKGRGWVLPETAREIWDDLKDLERRIYDERSTEYRHCKACGEPAAGRYCPDHI